MLHEVYINEPHSHKTLSFPTEHLRIACELIIVYFIVDEYTDVENATQTAEIVDIIIDALKNPHQPRPKCEVILGEIIRQSVFITRVS